jgi:hypothetical protein
MGFDSSRAKRGRDFEAGCWNFVDLVEMELHGVGVGARQRERSAFGVSRADSAEEIGAFIALAGQKQAGGLTGLPTPVIIS